MEFGLKWVHMAWYELILRLDGALWLTIIFRPLLTPKRANNASFGQWEAYYQNPLYLRSLHLTPTPEVQAWPGTWKSSFCVKTKTFVF